jgi:Flp pilus assembly protein TadG
MGFVLLLGLITRALAVVVTAKQFAPGWLFTRGSEMGLLATSLLHGEGLSSPFGGHTGPTAMIGPAYPLFVAGIFKLFGAYSGHAAVAIMAIQAAVSLLNLWLVMLLAERLWPGDTRSGRGAAWIGGLLWALSPAVFYMPTILWDTTFTTLLLSGALVLAIAFQQNPTRRRLLTLGGFCGLAYLINPALLLVAVALLVWSCFYGRRYAQLNPTLALVTFLLVCSPWPMRNALTMHAFIPVRETLGIELNMGNHPGSDGHMEESLFPLFNAAELAEYNEVGEVRYVQHKAHQAEIYIASHPQRFVRLSIQRFMRFWSGTGTRDGSMLFAIDAVPTTILGLLGLGVLWRRHRHVAVPFLIGFVLFPLPYYITHAEFRYRLTLDPLLQPLCGYALVSVAAWVRLRRPSQGPAAMVVSPSSTTARNAARFIAEQSGQTFVVAAVSMVVLVACLGLAIDVGHLRYEKRHLQQAADAAALAAGLELNVCGTTHNCTAMQKAAQTAAIENGYTPVVTILNCASSSNTGVVLTINNPSCATGASDSNNGNANYVEVVMAENVSTYFAPVLGFGSFPVAVRAEAGRAAAPCIYALDQSPLAVGITVTAGTVNANCPIIDEATAPLTAFNCVAGSVAATKITVGSSFGILSPLLCSVTPTPQTYTPLPTPADPLAYLPKPAVPGSCTGSPTFGLTTLQILGTATLNPGRYCGGITIGPLANVTFNPGVYVLTNTSVLNLVGLTGGLTITAGANVYGNGVVFYNDNTALLPNVTGGITFAGDLPVAGLGDITLIAPNSTNTVASTVNYQGILFFQDPNDTAPAVIAASTGMNTKLEGAFYFPSALVTYAVAGNARFNVLVAKDIVFGPVTFGGTAYENSVFGNDYSQLTNGSPIPATAAVLVQ